MKLLKLNYQACKPFLRFKSLIQRQNFTEKSEELLNRQITLELQACHDYLAMAYHFDRSDVASPGVFKFFKKASDEEREHACRIMEYMNKRGGQIVLGPLKEPVPSYASLKEAFQTALKMELFVNENLLELHKCAGEQNDANLCDFIETWYLQEQVDGQKILADYIRQIEKTENQLGDYLFDKYMTNGGMHGEEKKEE